MNSSIQKIEIISPLSKKGELMEALQNQGCLEIVSQGEGSELEEKEGDVDLQIANISFALNFLKRFQPKESFLKNIIYSFIPRFRKLTLSEARERATSDKVKEVVQECSRIQEEMNNLRSQKEKLIAEKEIISNFVGTTVVKSDKLDKVDCFVGYLNFSKKENFIEEIDKTHYLEEGEKGIVLYYLSSDRDFFSELLKKYGAKAETVFWNGLPEKEKREREKEIEEIDVQMEILLKQVEKMVVRDGELKSALDWWTWEKEKQETAQYLPQTDRYLVVYGWLPEKCFSEVAETAEKVSCFSVVRKVEPEEGETPPVALQNKGLMGSFELVTSIYGMPKSDEPDPTPFLSTFFIVFFGIALSDSGYGLLLIILSLLAKKKFSGVDRFFNLFIIAGISTVIAGIFSGTFFGTDITAGYRLIDPVSDPIGTLFFVMALGAIQITAGLAISLWWQIKQGNPEQAMATKGSPMLFFLGGAVAAITGNMMFLTIGLCLMVVMNIVYSSGAIIGRLAGGFGALYGLVGYFSDILSYSRLLALGLATGIIAMVINMIATIFMDMISIPVLNWVLFLTVLIAGHIANLMINALGSYIHSARLQFVEFFSKFMEGGGRTFKPFRKKGRYIQIIN
jgi:V/A-type H+/Na+-transporting ATPase subunit I